MKVKKRLRFSNPESESNSVLNCSLYVEPKLLEWSKNTRQNMEKNTKGNQCTSNNEQMYGIKNHYMWLQQGYLLYTNSTYILKVIYKIFSIVYHPSNAVRSG